MEKLGVVDLFAGCGGLSKGLEDAGFNIVLANEIHPDAAASYSKNLNGKNGTMKVCDIRELTDNEILKATGRGRVHVVTAGPPCQGFSMAGRRNIDDPRNMLFKHLVRVVALLKPDFFVMENVKGLLSLNQGKAIEAIEEAFHGIGYGNLKTQILNAVHFGIPQRRERVFIIGSLHEGVKLHPRNLSDKFLTIKDAIGDLEFLGPGEFSKEYKIEPMNEYQKRMRARGGVLYNHEAPNHKASIIERFAKLKQGMKIADLPPEDRTKKLVQYRLLENQPSPTIMTLPDDYIHYNRNRILTVRECARIQSFPDDFVFLGKRSTGGLKRRSDVPQYTQVGNAVPPLLAKAVGTHIKRQLERLYIDKTKN